MARKSKKAPARPGALWVLEYKRKPVGEELHPDRPRLVTRAGAIVAKYTQEEIRSAAVGLGLDLAEVKPVPYDRRDRG